MQHQCAIMTHVSPVQVTQLLANNCNDMSARFWSSIATCIPLTTAAWLRRARAAIGTGARDRLSGVLGSRAAIATHVEVGSSQKHTANGLWHQAWSLLEALHDEQEGKGHHGQPAVPHLCPLCEGSSTVPGHAEARSCLVARAHNRACSTGSSLDRASPVEVCTTCHRGDGPQDHQTKADSNQHWGSLDLRDKGAQHLSSELLCSLADRKAQSEHCSLHAPVRPAGGRSRTCSKTGLCVATSAPNAASMPSMAARPLMVSGRRPEKDMTSDASPVSAGRLPGCWPSLPTSSPDEIWLSFTASAACCRQLVCTKSVLPVHCVAAYPLQRCQGCLQSETHRDVSFTPTPRCGPSQAPVLSMCRSSQVDHIWDLLYHCICLAKALSPCLRPPCRARPCASMDQSVLHSQ